MAFLRDRGTKRSTGYINTPKVDFYHSQQWKGLKREIFSQYHTCKYCKRQLGKFKTLDHFRPLRFWPELATEKRNLYPCCRSCHAKKSARESQARTAKEWERIVLPKYRAYDRMSFLNGKKGDKPP